MKIIITYPQLTIERKEVEVTEQQFEELTQHAGDEEKSDFIWSKMTDYEQSWTTNGKKSVEAALDIGYCGISKI